LHWHETLAAGYDVGMNTNKLLAASLTVVLFLSLGNGGSVARAAETAPNIVVFLVDDMGVMDTSVPFLTDEQGKPKRYPLNDYYRTPNMQRLAAKGVRFNNFYAMSVCSPTRISIMTGQNAARHHATNWINPRNDNRGPHGPPDWNWQGLNSGSVTLPRLLRKAGYHTIHVGKGHFGPDSSEGSEPLNLGFDVNVGGASFGAPGSYYGEENYGLGTKRASHAVPHLKKYHGSDMFLTEAITREAKKRVSESVQQRQPFYLYMSHYAVHAPFHSDPRFADHYKDSGKSKNAQAFATLIEGMDKSLGDLLDHFDALGVSENTLVFFLGDNGSDAPLGHQHVVACAAPLRGKKGAHYEGGMRVPFIAAWAKESTNNVNQQQLVIPAGTLQTQVAAVQDLYPTIAKLTGATSPAGHTVDGVDLSKLLTAEPDDSREEVFLMHYPHSPHRSDYFTTYRDGDWKVIYHYIPSKGSEGGHYQLYNLASDPFESTNLADQEPVVLREMIEKLKSGLESHEALYPVSPDDGKTPLVPATP
jgi:arylsulfatase A-like enzyme